MTNYLTPSKISTNAENSNNCYVQRLRNEIYRNYYGWLLTPFAVTVFISTSSYILAMGKAIYDHRVSRKFYALLLNRSISDLIAAIFTLTTSLYVFVATDIELILV